MSGGTNLLFNRTFLKTALEQECIPVGCVPPAFYTCPPPCIPPPMHASGHTCPPPPHSFQKQSCQILGFRPKLKGWQHPPPLPSSVWEILDLPLEVCNDAQTYSWRLPLMLHFYQSRWGKPVQSHSPFLLVTPGNSYCSILTDVEIWAWSVSF